MAGAVSIRPIPTAYLEPGTETPVLPEGPGVGRLGLSRCLPGPPKCHMELPPHLWQAGLRGAATRPAGTESCRHPGPAPYLQPTPWILPPPSPGAHGIYNLLGAPQMPEGREQTGRHRLASVKGDGSDHCRGQLLETHGPVGWDRGRWETAGKICQARPWPLPL